MLGAPLAERGGRPFDGPTLESATVIRLLLHALVAELVDALGSKPSGRKVVWVRVPPRAPCSKRLDAGSRLQPRHTLRARWRLCSPLDEIDVIHALGNGAPKQLSRIVPSIFLMGVDLVFFAGAKQRTQMSSVKVGTNACPARNFVEHVRFGQYLDEDVLVLLKGLGGTAKDEPPHHVEQYGVPKPPGPWAAGASGK
jgi:hypothetical protein